MSTDNTDIGEELTAEHGDTEGVEREPTDGEQLDEPRQNEAEIVGGLDENVAGALTYLFGFITGLIFYLVEDENTFVRFHAVQSMLVFGGLIALSFGITFMQIFLEMIPVIGWMMSLGLGLFAILIMPIGFVLWLVLLIKAYKGQRYGLPVVGDIAERHA